MNTRHFKLNATADELLRRARAVTGIDIDDQGIRERLQRLVDSLNTEAELTEAGAEEVERGLLLLMCNRLRLQRDLRAHPEIEDQAIRRPLIMTGGGRTGSTKLHKMLAASGDFQYLPAWRNLSPSLIGGDRSEDPGERIRAAAERIDWFNAHAPEARLIHEISTSEPEEEALFLSHSLYAPYLQAYFFIPSYLQWHMAQTDPLEEMKFLKRGLQYLQWQSADGQDRPWILKSPIHLGAEPLLAKVFPDARFVTTNRDPVATFPSAVSLLHHYRSAYSDTDRRREFGPMMLEWLAAWTEQALAARAELAHLPFLDLAYLDVVADSAHVVERVYAHHGLELSQAAREAMRRWEIDNAQHKHGVHKPVLADYGLSEDAVRARFGRFVETRGALL